MGYFCKFLILCRKTKRDGFRNNTKQKKKEFFFWILEVIQLDVSDYNYNSCWGSIVFPPPPSLVSVIFYDPQAHVLFLT